MLFYIELSDNKPYMHGTVINFQIINKILVKSSFQFVVLQCLILKGKKVTIKNQDAWFGSVPF